LFEPTLLVIEDFFHLGKYFREKACLGPGEHALVGSLVASVEKAVVLFVVPVEVTEDCDALRACGLVCHCFFDEIDLRVDRWVGVGPTAIEIEAD
jgi:hypothetical protein